MKLPPFSELWSLGLIWVIILTPVLLSFTFWDWWGIPIGIGAAALLASAIIRGSRRAHP